MKQQLLLMLFSLATTQGMAKSNSIVNDATVGCTDSAYMTKLYQYAHEKDAVAFKSTLLSGISQGICAKFSKGEKVAVIDANAASGQVEVSRTGETEKFWLFREDIN